MPPRNNFIRENVYGHTKRLKWIIGHLNKDQEIVEVGCGTGYMITLQLAKLGYNITGLDLDQKSIAYGKELFIKENMNPNLLRNIDISDFDRFPNVIILSEVLEHLTSENLKRFMNVIYTKLRPQGTLLITIPNGYGWFELESFLWWKVRVGELMERIGLIETIQRLKSIFWASGHLAEPYVSTLNNTPHLQ
ncbi:MAG: class I SAM-dependent methyltransferase, partial [Nitrospiria bacterium]